MSSNISDSLVFITKLNSTYDLLPADYVLLLLLFLLIFVRSGDKINASFCQSFVRESSFAFFWLRLFEL